MGRYICKIFLWFLLFVLIDISFANIRVFQTENVMNTQAYDCIYYTNVTAVNNEIVSYCIRTKENVPLNRSFVTNTCENAGVQWTFKRLKEMNLSQDQMLTWNSSIEMVDRYGAYLINGYVKKC